MIDFETWWNSSSADEFRRLNDDMDGRVVRPVWDAAIRATLSSQKATSAAPSPEATQPTQAEAASVTTSQTVDDLIANAAQARERDAKWQQWVERGGYDGDQQAEAPSEREAREMQEVADKLREAGYHSAANNTERTIADIKSGNMPRAVIGAALATQQAVQGEPVAFEFYNPTTGHAIVDYSRQTHVGPLTKEMGYEARALGYINPPPAAVKPGDPVPLWQALEALDSLEESSRGDAPYNHFAAGLVRSALEQSATPPAPGQVERDGEDAGAIAYQLTKRLVIDIPTARAAVDAAIRAARSSEGGGNEHSR